MPHEAVGSALSSRVQENFVRNSPREAARKLTHVFSEPFLVFVSRFFLSFSNLYLGMSQNKIFLTL